MGKMILFSAIAFIILTREIIKDIKHIPYKKFNIVFTPSMSIYTFTSIQYVFFTIIAVYGYLEWKKILQQKKA